MYKKIKKDFIEKNLKKIETIDKQFSFNEAYEYYILEIDNEIIGYSVLENSDKIATLINIFIKEDKRHNDYATNFVKYLERIKGKDGIEKIIVKEHTCDGFFQKTGFKRSEEGFFYDKIYERKKRFQENGRVILFSILGNILLAATKIFFGIKGKSRALFSDGINSLSDVATSTGMYIGNWYSNQPADESHPYGHEKVESIIANILGIFMILTAFELGRGSITLLYSVIKGESYSAPNIETIWWGLLSAVIKYAMFYYKLKVGEKTQNHALIADAKDSRNDIFTSLGAVLGILLGIYINPIFDIVLSLPIAIMIFKEGVGVILENADLILDKQDSELIEDIKNFIKRETKIENVHNIRTRTSGDKLFLSLHIRVPKEKTVEEAHYISHGLEESLYIEFENLTEITIHIEPLM